MQKTPDIQLTTANTAEAEAWLRDALAIENTAKVPTDGPYTSQAISLNFPKFTDGRAYSQAALLRGRLGATGPLIATGDVLVDQVLQMARCGFSHAILRADQSLEAAERQLARYSRFYQVDAYQTEAPLRRED
jgi:uncharacterized protein (DUF934 family)